MVSASDGEWIMGNPISETIDQHVTTANVTITLTRFGQRYYVERVGPLGHRISDVPHESLWLAKAHFLELVNHHNERKYGHD